MNIPTFANLLLEVSDNIAVLTVNRPDKLNALNIDTISELSEAADWLKSSNEVKGVIITGSGKAFVAGADISELVSLTAVEAREYALAGQAAFKKFEDLRKPVVAAVNGFALGGGCELAMSCHIRIVSEKAKFGQPEVNLGVIAGFGGTQRLTRIIGLARSIDLHLSGRIIDASEALSLGLANKVVPVDELMVEAKHWLAGVLSKGPLAVAYALEAIYGGFELPLEKALRLEADLFGLVFSTDDKTEGCSAFVEKRPANFKNK